MEKTKTYLANALLELLKEKDFDKIKVNEICDKALIHKTTFYNHFEDKYELLNYTLLKIHHEITDNTKFEGSLIDYYLSIAKYYIKYIKDNPELFKSIIANDNNTGLILFQKLYVKDIAEKITINNIREVPANYAAHFYVSAVLAIISEWFINGMKEDEETLLNYIKVLIKEEKAF
ncbi:MAG: TetR/AcrR family transcriptional regulator C-terminal domain-containing protein [Bacilli bacterium]|nr:TetR/AcrR family transcriptional regulator C-terminal domain-containing protein [Bacilli bacterium]